MSMCGMQENGGPPTDEEFARHLVTYPDVSWAYRLQGMCVCVYLCVARHWQPDTLRYKLPALHCTFNMCIYKSIVCNPLHTRFPLSFSPVQVCKNPNMFSSPNLVVRLNGKYFTWMAACPIVMTMITFQKPLTDVSLRAKPSKDSLLIPASIRSPCAGGYRATNVA